MILLTPTAATKRSRHPQYYYYWEIVFNPCKWTSDGLWSEKRQTLKSLKWRKNKFSELKNRPLDRVSIISLALPKKSIDLAFPLLTLLWPVWLGLKQVWMNFSISEAIMHLFTVSKLRRRLNLMITYAQLIHKINKYVNRFNSVKN